MRFFDPRDVLLVFSHGCKFLAFNKGFTVLEVTSVDVTKDTEGEARFSMFLETKQKINKRKEGFTYMYM